MKDDFVSPNDATHDSVATSVLERARNGEETAFERIYSLYALLVFHWCRKAGIDEADSCQVSQEVFLSVHQGLKGFKREKPGDSFQAWLRTITRTRIADYYRQTSDVRARGGDGTWLGELANPSSESTDEIHQETLLLYERALHLIESEFSTQDCTAFKLFVIEGLTGNEIAEQLKMSPNSVYIAKSRILARLRSEFKDVMELDP